jgi:hypothetical protein
LSDFFDPHSSQSMHPVVLATQPDAATFSLAVLHILLVGA